jgi:pyruvate kinase
MSQVKIVATIGPSTDNADVIRALQQAGMGIARLNGSHADLQWHARTIGMIREVAPDVPVLFDIPGRKIRLGKLDEDLTFEAGELVVLSTEPAHHGLPKVSITHPNLHGAVSPGDVILADQGALRFTIIEVNKRDMVCRAETDGSVRSGQGLHFPGLSLQGEFLSEQDRGLIE